jgi:hypothetical protein
LPISWCRAFATPFRLADIASFHFRRRCIHYFWYAITCFDLLIFGFDIYAIAAALHFLLFAFISLAISPFISLLAHYCIDFAFDAWYAADISCRHADYAAILITPFSLMPLITDWRHADISAVSFAARP